MNVPRGVYTVQTGVWDRRREAVMGRGPAMVVQVGEGTQFGGVVQLNPQMQVLSAAPALVATR